MIPSRGCLFCPAKVNLTLEVLGKREDGYHELVSCVAPVSLTDHLHFERASAFSLTVEGPFAAGCAGKNLIETAWERFGEAWGAPPLALRLEKFIPVGGGLGGGSSDVGRFLKLMSWLAAKPPGLQILHEAAVSLGADVAFFLNFRPAIMWGIGDRLLPFHFADHIPITVVYPDTSVETRSAYAALTAPPFEESSRQEAMRRAEHVVYLCDVNKLSGADLTNDFERVISRPPGLEGDWHLSGSGACWFKLGHASTPYEHTYRVETV